MNWEQWVFEARGLQKKEQSEAEARIAMAESCITIGRDMAINLLGLNILTMGKPQEKGKPPSVVPLAMMVGHPEVLQALLEEAKKGAGEAAASEDDVFEALSSQLHQQLKTGQSDLPGDMVPLLTTDDFQLDHNSYWNSADAQAQLQAMGVKPRVDGRPVVHIETKEAKKRKPDLDLAELERFEAAMRGKS